MKYLPVLARGILIGCLLAVYSRILNIPLGSLEYWKFMIVGSILIVAVINTRLTHGK